MFLVIFVGIKIKYCLGLGYGILYWSKKGHDLEPNTAERRDLHGRVF